MSLINFFSYLFVCLFVYWCRFGRYSKRNRFTFLALQTADDDCVCSHFVSFFNWMFVCLEFDNKIKYSSFTSSLICINVRIDYYFGVQEKPHWISNANRQLLESKQKERESRFHSSNTCLLLTTWSTNQQDK